MKPLIFKEIWDSVWPNRKLELTGLKTVWGPEVKALKDRAVIAFLRKWASQHTWPPSLHEFMVGMGVAKIPPSSRTHQVAYRCEHCGTDLEGYQAYDAHLTGQHPEQIADPEKVTAMISEWREQHRPTKSRDPEATDPAVAETATPAPNSAQGAPDLGPAETTGEVSADPENAVSGEPPPL